MFFLFTKCGFGRILRGECDSLQTSKQELLPSRPQSHAFVCYGDASRHANHHPSLTILAPSASPIGRAFTWRSVQFVNTFTNNPLVAHSCTRHHPFQKTSSLHVYPRHLHTKQTSNPSKIANSLGTTASPCLLAPGTRNTHSTESAFCNPSKKRLSGHEATRDPAAWLCGLAALAGLASLVCPRAD